MEDDPGDKFGQTITLSNPVFLSGIRVGPDEEEVKQADEGTEPETSGNPQSDETPQNQDDAQPEEISTGEGKEPDVLNIDVEPLFENEKPNLYQDDENDTPNLNQDDENNESDLHQDDENENHDLHQDVEDEKPDLQDFENDKPDHQDDENVVNSNPNEQASDAIQKVSSADVSTNKIDNFSNNQENDNRTSGKQSGRQSLKARVQKLMWLGRSQSSLQGRDDDFFQQEENLSSSKPNSALTREEDVTNENIEEDAKINFETNLERNEERIGQNILEGYIPDDDEQLIPSQQTDIENRNPEENAESETKEEEFQDDSLNETEEETEQLVAETEIVSNDNPENAEDHENNESSETTSKSTISGTDQYL